MKITKVEKHPKGGHIVTFVLRHDIGSDKETIHAKNVMLREGPCLWRFWPSLKKPEFFSKYKEAWDQREAMLKYQPEETPVEDVREIEAKPRGSDRRCVFCHQSASGLVACCLDCGATLHLECVRESGQGCPTLGCVKVVKR